MGVVIFELLFGKRPFRGRTSKDVAMRICKGALQFPNSRGLSADCYDFITKVAAREGMASFIYSSTNARPLLRSY